MKKFQYNMVASDSLHYIDLIYIPCDQDEVIPSLLDYPWLVHELGHYLLQKHGKTLFDKFTPYLDDLISRLKIRSIPDRGLAKTRSQEVIEEIDSKWRQSPWVIEIAVDTIALWACGPTYIEVFQEYHKDVDNPFYIDSEHPPVELRTYALLQVAQRLGWHKHLEDLKQIQQRWQKSMPASVRNKYNSLRQNELVDGCLEATFAYCESVKIPCLKSEHLDRIRLNLKQEACFPNGVDLIVGAWLVHHEKEEEL